MRTQRKTVKIGRRKNLGLFMNGTCRCYYCCYFLSTFFHSLCCATLTLYFVFWQQAADCENIIFWGLVDGISSFYSFMRYTRKFCWGKNAWKCSLRMKELRGFQLLRFIISLKYIINCRILPGIRSIQLVLEGSYRISLFIVGFKNVCKQTNVENYRRIFFLTK